MIANGIKSGLYTHTVWIFVSCSPSKRNRYCDQPYFKITCKSPNKQTIIRAVTIYDRPASCVTIPQDDESKCHKPFCHLYQKSLNISVSNTSFFPSKPTGEIMLTTESLYNHMDLGGSFRENSVHSWKVQGQPDRPFRDTRCLTWLSTQPGYRAAVVRSHKLQSCRYFLTKFLCHTVCSYSKDSKRENMDKKSLDASVGR